MTTIQKTKNFLIQYMNTAVADGRDIDRQTASALLDELETLELRIGLTVEDLDNEDYLSLEDFLKNGSNI